MMERILPRLISSPGSTQTFEKGMPARMNCGTTMPRRISMCSPFELTSHPCTTQLEDWSFSFGHVPTANWVSLSCSEVYMDCSMRFCALLSSETLLSSLRLMEFRRGNSCSILDSGLDTVMSSRASSTFLRRCVRTASVLAAEARSIASLTLVSGFA